MCCVCECKSASRRSNRSESVPAVGVLLTLLSIVQALALELIWSHLHEVDYLFEVSLTAAIAWLQIGATLLGIVLI